jgi:hypothetical protein
MSASTKITIFDQMTDALIHSVTSEATGFLAENLVAPMPNCYWKSNEADTQHQIVLNLQAMKYSNVFMLITAHEENSDTLAGIGAEIEYANTADGTWTAVSNLVDPGIIDGLQLKLFRYDFAAYINQYWRITLLGYESPDYYPPDATMLYSAWIGREWTLNVPHAWPSDTKLNYEFNPAKLAYGMRHTMPLAYAPTIELEREYLLTGDDVQTFEYIMQYQSGMPVCIQEGENSPFLATIVDVFTRQQVTPDIQLARIRIRTIPILRWDKGY